MPLDGLSVLSLGYVHSQPTEHEGLCLLTLGYVCQPLSAIVEEGIPRLPGAARPGAGGGVPYTPHVVPISAFIEAAREIGRSFETIEERRMDESLFEAQLASLEIASVVEEDDDRSKYTAGVIMLATKDE